MKFVIDTDVIFSAMIRRSEGWYLDGVMGLLPEEMRKTLNIQSKLRVRCQECRL